MIHAWLKAATAVAAAGAVGLSIAPADAARSKQRNTNVRDTQAQQYPNWERVTSAPRSRDCIGTCSRYNLPPGGGINYLEDGVNRYGGAP
jgi:hypothetical protein